MFRVPTIVGLVVASLAMSGCTGTWDTLTSRRFRQAPYDTTKKLVSPEDPIVVLRASPPRDGDDRAKAMLRLKEPLTTGLTQRDQDEVIDILARAATTDPSPYMRLAAIHALGRFQDQRAGGILVMAFQNAHGRMNGMSDPTQSDPLLQLAVAPPIRTSPRGSPLLLNAPTGFPPETVAAIRCGTLEAIGRSPRSEGIQFLASVAVGTGNAAPDGAEDRDVRLAAIRGLTQSRTPEAVVVLAQALAADNKQDLAITKRLHEGLVSLTGKGLPPDPEQWNAVVQAGVVIAPEPTWLDSAVKTAEGWIKK